MQDKAVAVYLQALHSLQEFSRFGLNLRSDVMILAHAEAEKSTRIVTEQEPDLDQARDK